MKVPNIIGIHGAIGSGKDTLAKLMLMLIANKDLKPEFSLEESLNDRVLKELELYSNWKIKKFAGKLKLIASILTGHSIEKFEDRDFKNSELDSEWNNVTEIFSADAILTKSESITVRQFMQKLGTDALRNNLNLNVWINALWADYKSLNDIDMIASSSGFKLEIEEIYPNWIITDLRFSNEAQSIKQKGGILISIQRPFYSTVQPNAHASETELNDYPFDYVIKNDGDLNQLLEKTKNILKILNLL